MSIPPCVFQGWPSACLTTIVFGHAPAQGILLASTTLGIGKHQSWDVLSSDFHTIHASRKMLKLSRELDWQRGETTKTRTQER